MAVAEGLLGDRDEAADAVQEAFVKAYRALGRLREGSDFGAWFAAIVRNQCLDRLRAARRLGERWSEAAIDGEAWAEPDAHDGIEQGELAAFVRSALAALSPEHREVLVLKEMEGMSYAAIAESTGLAPGTVASRLHHARGALKKVLLARGIRLEEG
jgi:RNA polymerase sigma-70 factor, ECF subfamily